MSIITACVVYELKLFCIRKYTHTEKFGINGGDDDDDDDDDNNNNNNNNMNNFLIYSCNYTNTFHTLTSCLETK